MRKAIIGAFGILVVVILAVVTGCTENERVKMGGSATFDLPAGQKLITCTWKEGSDLWYLTRPFEKGEKPTTLEFQQKSSWGTRNGTFYIKESLADTVKVASVLDDYDTHSVRMALNRNEIDLSDLERSTP